MSKRSQKKGGELKKLTGHHSESYTPVNQPKHILGCLQRFDFLGVTSNIAGWRINHVDIYISGKSGFCFLAGQVSLAKGSAFHILLKLFTKS